MQLARFLSWELAAFARDIKTVNGSRAALHEPVEDGSVNGNAAFCGAAEYAGQIADIITWFSPIDDIALGGARQYAEANQEG